MIIFTLYTRLFQIKILSKTTHPQRHLFSTHANEHDHQQKDIIEAALAHRDTNRIRATYNKATYLKERLELAQWYADYLDELKSGAKVIPFKQA